MPTNETSNYTEVLEKLSHAEVLYDGNNLKIQRLIEIIKMLINDVKKLEHRR